MCSAIMLNMSISYIFIDFTHLLYIIYLHINRYFKTIPIYPTLFHCRMDYPCFLPLLFLQPPIPTEGKPALTTSIYLLNYIK